MILGMSRTHPNLATYPPPNVSRDDLMPMYEAAAAVGVDERAIRRSVSRGDLVAYRDPADKRRRLVDAAAAAVLFTPVPLEVGNDA